MTADRVRAGHTTERVGFFTDAVFAIAMTLLVIEIPRPEEAAEFSVGGGVSKAEAAGNLWHFLTGQTGSSTGSGTCRRACWGGISRCFC